MGGFADLHNGKQPDAAEPEGVDEVTLVHGHEEEPVKDNRACNISRTIMSTLIVFVCYRV